VLEGNITFYVGEETHKAGPGTLGFLLHGVPHSYAFGTDVISVRTLVAPDGFEEHFLGPRAR